jgi:ATP-dependent RNA helicase DHX57
MVKKGQSKGGKPGGGGGVKKPPALPSTGDDSFIVFSNSDKEPKPRRPAASNETTAGPSGLDGPALAGEAPKRPDVMKILGGASWTGKLPVNMLSEHCQKQKWEKPDYSMVGETLLQAVTYANTSCSPRRLKGTLRWLHLEPRTRKHRSW